MNKKIYALFTMLSVIAIVLSACAVGTVDSASMMIKSVPCPRGSKFDGTCIVRENKPDVLVNGQVDNIGLADTDYVYAEISAPEGTFLYTKVLSGSIDSTGDGTNFVTISLSGKGVASVQIRLSCNPNSNGEEILIKHYKQFK